MIKNNLFNKKYILIILILIFILLSSNTAFASVSLPGDFLNKVFEINLNDGTDFFRPNQKNRKIYNDNIYNNTEQKSISLYDRFGGEIYFIPYYGEKKFELTLIDTLYENFKENNDSFSFQLSDLWKKDTSILNNEVYKNRPEIISESDRKNGAQDPRREHYSGLSITGGSAALGNFYLSIGNFITRFITWLSGNGLFLLVSDIWDSITKGDFWESISTQIMIFIPILSVFFVIFLLRSIIKAVSGKNSMNKIIIGIINYIIAFSIVVLLLSNPNVFGNITKNIILFIDNIFSISLSTASNSEVVKSDDLTLVMEASIWEKAIFNPWCKGMFDGKTYSELYTQFDEDPNHKKLYQTNDNIFDYWDDGSLRYNSSYHTGDIKIPLGGNGEYYVRNWAALAWSTQSIYHIDAVGHSPTNVNKWPSATTTPNNPNIFIDNFRWLDAKLNISPEYRSPNEYENNYHVGKKLINGKRIELSKPYNESFINHGLEALWMSILLLPFIYPILKRLISMMQIIGLGFNWLIKSFVTMVKPSSIEYNNINNLKKILKPIYHYFWWSLFMFILITFYITITGSFIGNFLYIYLSIVLIRVAKPIDNYRQLNNTIKYGKVKYNEAKDYIKRKVNNLKMKKI